MKTSRLMIAPLVLAAMLGCDSTITGNEGNLTFSYDADDAVLDFNKPIAVGAMLDLMVAEVGTGEDAAILAASTDDEAVLSVTEFAGATLTLEAMTEGSALVLVDAETSSGPVSDSVMMSAAVPEVLIMSHTCGEQGGAYLTGQSIYVPFEFELANGQPVIGYGYYPVNSSNQDVLVRDESFNGQQYMRLDTLAAGEASLDSDIDDGSLALTVVDEAAIDGVTEPLAFVLEDIDVGDTNPFYVLPSVAGVSVCQAQATMEVQSDTPELCAVRTIGSEVAAGDARYESGWFEIEGLQEGTCAYTVTYPLGADGAGASASFTFPIQL